jgi:hypothetical protein
VGDVVVGAELAERLTGGPASSQRRVGDEPTRSRPPLGSRSAGAAAAARASLSQAWLRLARSIIWATCSSVPSAIDSDQLMSSSCVLKRRLSKVVYGDERSWLAYKVDLVTTAFHRRWSSFQAEYSRMDLLPRRTLGPVVSPP